MTTTTSKDYLDHHLQFFKIGDGFSAFHFDSILMSLVCAVLIISILLIVARKPVVNGVPGKLQCAVEIMVDWVNGMVTNITGNNKSTFVAPLALTVFIWVLVMNVIDLIPVDWIPGLAHLLGASHFRALPTADVNIIVGMSLVIVVITVFFGFRYKGIAYAKDFYLHPFKSHWMIPINLALEIVSFLAKPLSLTLRLFGNLFAGEVIFLLIATMYGANLLLGAAAIPLQLAWSILHVLVIFLQAFVFMILTIIYLTQAAQSEDH